MTAKSPSRAGPNFEGFRLGKRQPAESPGLDPTAATVRRSDSRARAIGPEPGGRAGAGELRLLSFRPFNAQRFFVAAMIALLPAAESLRLGLGAAAGVAD